MKMQTRKRANSSLKRSVKLELEVSWKPSREDALTAIQCLIAYIGDDPFRPGLRDTPERVIRAWETDWGVAYNKDYIAYQKKSILKGRFEDGAEKQSTMILVRSIRFVSHCEHHLAIFAGQAHVAYIPQETGPVLGLSKLVRVVDMFSKRLQIQERLTNQIADFINDECKPIGVGVLIEATHSCMTSRGVHQHDTEATTSALRGEMLDKPEVRDEFLRLVGK
jgi:GTP cyclohydrolase I